MGVSVPRYYQMRIRNRPSSLSFQELQGFSRLSLRTNDKDLRNRDSAQ